MSNCCDNFEKLKIKVEFLENLLVFFAHKSKDLKFYDDWIEETNPFTKEKLWTNITKGVSSKTKPIVIKINDKLVNEYLTMDGVDPENLVIFLKKLIDLKDESETKLILTNLWYQILLDGDDSVEDRIKMLEILFLDEYDFLHKDYIPNFNKDFDKFNSDSKKQVDKLISKLSEEDREYIKREAYEIIDSITNKMKNMEKKKEKEKTDKLLSDLDAIINRRT
jgi:hypothetical protein